MSKDYRDTLIQLFERLKPTPMFQVMLNTVEGSPWHREANVLVHTGMVLNEYIRRTDDESPQWTREDFLGGVAAIFHDTGKPIAKIEKHSEKRGTYFAFHGHELVSARCFEDFALANPQMFLAEDIAKVCWIIEYHMPWSLEDTEKRRQMALTAHWVNPKVFIRHLLADQYGRTSDDESQVRVRADEWSSKFLELARNTYAITARAESPQLIMPIGPSGAGKSTYLKMIRETNPSICVFSLDLLRHEFYDTTYYAKAYSMSVEDPEFANKANARFAQMLKLNGDLYVDNTNLSAKRRKGYIQAARKLGFTPVAVLMPVGLNTVIDRQAFRGDKNVPAGSVRQQYNALQMPMLGEFDWIVHSNHNIIEQLDIRALKMETAAL